MRPRAAFLSRRRTKPSIDGIHDQNVSLVVTDSYGCVSLPSTQTVYALEFPVLNLETELACDGDTVTLGGFRRR